MPSEAFGHLAFLGEPFASPCNIEPTYFRRFFAQDLSAKKAALLNAKQRPVNFHSRSTPAAASALLRRGVHPKVGSDALGHACTAFTTDVYSHLLPSQLNASAAERINKLICRGA